MGSGILAENIADKFRSVIANYFDPQEGDYFQTIRKYPSMFKSLVLCFDRATSTLDEKQEKEIMTSIIKSLETMQPCNALKLLVALEFFLKQNFKDKTNILYKHADFTKRSIALAKRLTLYRK